MCANTLNTDYCGKQHYNRDNLCLFPRYTFTSYSFTFSGSNLIQTCFVKSVTHECFDSLSAWTLLTKYSLFFMQLFPLSLFSTLLSCFTTHTALSNVKNSLLAYFRETAVIF